MPSWKKVVTFGSDAQLNSLNVTTYVSASEFRGPLTGTSSFATSASYAVTASYAENAPIATTASYALTASSADDFNIRGNLTGTTATFSSNITASNLLVNNAITAQTLIVQVITSSTEFVTGSTIFGSQLTDTHQFTGSVTITGSLSLNGDPIVVSSSFYPFSQSVQVRLTNLESTSSVLTSASASFAQDSGSNSIRITNVEFTSSALTTASSSFSTRVTTLESASSSFAQDSGSNSIRFTNLESTSSALVQASASFDTRILNNSSSIATLSSSFLAASASFDNRINNISGSYVTTASYLVDSASFSTRITNNSSSIAVLSGSFLVASASFDTRINSLTESVFTHVVTNNGSSNYIIDGVAKPKLSFVPGATYRFNTTAVGGSHPFRFSTSPNGPTEYTTGVTIGSGYTQIEVNYDTPTTLYYYCTIHSGMGNEINVLRVDTLVTTASFNSFTSSYYTDSSSFDARILNNSASIATLSSSFLASSASFDTRILANSSSVAILSSSFLTTSASYASLSGSFRTGSYTGSFVGVHSGSFSGSFFGDGGGLTNISASSVVGLNLSQIASGSVTASVDPAYGFKVNSNTQISGSTQITGSLGVTGSVSISGSTGTLFTANVDTLILTGSLVTTGSMVLTGSMNVLGGITSSLFGTASWAVSASHAPSSLTASYAISASYAETASSADNFVVRGNLTGSNALFSGTITAQTLYVQTITSSVDFVTGSTRFGTQLTDTHQFTGSVSITGSLSVNNSPVITSDQTGSITVLSSSYASTASYAFEAVSSSYSTTASYAVSATSASYSVSSSYAQSATSASYAFNATTASYSLQALSSSYSITSSYSEFSTSSSYALQATSASHAINSNTASYVQNAQTASYVLNAVSASYASQALSSSYAITASYAENVPLTASYALKALSASYSETSSIATSASYAVTAAYAANVPATASYALQSLSSSYALTASFALNAGGTGISAIYIADEGNVQGTASFFDFVGAGVSATITNGTASINIPGGGGGTGGVVGQNAILTQSVASTTWSFTHNLGTQYPVFTIFDANDDVIIPVRIHAATTASAFIYFSSARTGYAVAALGGGIVSSSYAVSASYAFSSTSASYAQSSSNSISSSYALTASYVQLAQTASYVLNAVSSSFATTASYAANVPATASYALQSLSSSYAVTASHAQHALTSSYSLNALSSSYALTASYAFTAVSTSFAASSSFSTRTTQIDVYVKNVSGAQINKGTVVRISGATGDNPLIVTASYTNDSNSANTLGITSENIANDSFGYVISEGILIGINTDAFTAGQLLYLGPTGSIIGTAPVAPLHAVRLGEVLRVQQNNGSMYVRIDNGYEIGELHDVVDTTTTSSYGDLLVKSGSVWTNSKQLTGSYGLTGSLAATQITASGLSVTNAITASSITANSASFGYVQTITGSAVIIGQEYIVLNTQTPASRYAGLVIYDSGSNDTASIVWDSQNNHLVYQNVSGASYTGGGFMSGPRNSGSLAEVSYPTLNRVVRGQGGDHIYDSNIIDDDTKISLGINTQVTGSLIVSAGITGNLTGTASYASEALTSSFATTASYVQLAQTASYVQNAQTASYVLNAVSASYSTQALSASYSDSSSVATTASYAVTAAYAANVPSTASYALQALSSSYALTASFALNGGGGGISAIYIADEGALQGTASYFDFTGAGVTATVSAGTASINITSTGGGSSAGLTTTFTQSVAADPWTFIHNLNTRTPLVQVYDTSYNQITPQYVSASNANTVIIGFGVATAGYAVASTGGTLVVTGSNVILNQSVAATTWSFAHNLNTQYPIFQVFNSLDEVVIPEKIVASSTTGSFIYFPSAISGKAVASVGGLSGSISASYAIQALSSSYASSALSSSYALTASFALNGGGGGISSISIAEEGTLIGTASYFDFIGNNITASVNNGTASITVVGANGTAALTQSAAAATWSFTHNLNTFTPLIQAYNTSYSQIIPNEIVGISPNLAEIRFDYSQSGYAVASNGGPLTVSGSTARLNQSVAAVTWSFGHNLNSQYVNFEVYDSNNFVIIPANIKAVDSNNAELYFATPSTGVAIAMFSGINGAPNAVSASFATTASYAATASYLNPVTSGYVVLTQVSSSLNYVDDAAAAAGGVPLGGLYRNGNFIMIRIV